MNYVAPKTVLFDLDGTLADTVPLIVATFQRTVSQALGWEPTLAQCKEWIGRSLTETFTTLAPEVADELTARYLEWNLANHQAYVRPFDGVGALIGGLRASGRPFGVVTSKRHASALVSLECVGLTGQIPLLVTEEDTATHKPSPEPLLRTLVQLGVAPQETLFFGDTHADAACAQAAGVRFAWHSVGYGDARVQALPQVLRYAGYGELLHQVGAQQPALSL